MKRYRKAFVLMTAMPPTKGHLHLIQFAEQLAKETVVLVCTQPSEPYPHERFTAVLEAAGNKNVRVFQYHKEIEQNPKASGFWGMWIKIMQDHGFRDGDLFVSSEAYGQTMANLLNGHFLPYDPERELYYCKATNVRNDPDQYFSDILPEFQKYLRMSVTLFGAESTGKTTLSKELSIMMNGHWLFEYARPYLEMVGDGTTEHDITIKTMTDIWHGQNAIQQHVSTWRDKPFVFLDTDLYSTLGYWQMEHWSHLGTPPAYLKMDAVLGKSDLYLITKSNIPYEQDPIRYGGIQREVNDDYWINFAKDNNLNYYVLESDTIPGRKMEAWEIIMKEWRKRADKIYFERQSND